MARKAKCLMCQRQIENLASATPTQYQSGIGYYCEECANTLVARRRRGYNDENTVFVGKPTNDGHTISKEFEISNHAPFTQDDDKVKKVFTAFHIHKYLITNDCTVFVEMKSPVYNGLNTYNKDIKTLADIVEIERWYQHTDYGTHTNIGHINFGKTEMDIVRQWRETLVRPLQNAIDADLEGCKLLYGRTWVYYAARLNDYCRCQGLPEGWEYDHGCFINLQHDNWIEFRMNKFCSVEQDRRATKMSIEFFDAMHNFAKAVLANRRTYNGQTLRNKNGIVAKKAAEKMVEIFKKYAKEAREAQSVTA